MPSGFFQSIPRLYPRTLRNQLFLASALSATVILAIAAWVINHQVVGQARQQVQAEVETLLPLYDAIWSERARRLATLGATIADSSILKTISGDERASRDRETLREMIADLKIGSVEPGDLFLISDGAGQVYYAEQQGGEAPATGQLEAARMVGETQAQAQGFTLLGGRLFQLALTPVVLHSGNDNYNNTLAVLGTGSELNRSVALDIKRRIQSDLIFYLRNHLLVSTFKPEQEQAAVDAASVSEVRAAEPERPVEIKIDGDLYLAFSRQLTDFGGEVVGQVVILRSLAGAGLLFRAISNRLLLLWTVGVALAWLSSYLIAGRITQPIESLASSAREFGRGNYDFPVSDEAQGEAQGEIAQLAQSFDQMRQSLKRTQGALLRSERLATIGRMASSIIHDLRNPLATISTAAEVLKNDGLAADRRRMLLESQLRASHRMNEMMAELLEFSRGNYKLNRRGLSLDELIQEATQELSVQMAHFKIKLTAAVAPDILIEADEDRIRRVFENLLTNSIQAMPEGGQISIMAQVRDDFVRLQVIDNGPGVPAQIRERLFEPFITHGKPSGIGLGLAIARGIVEAHGGKIGLADSPEGGAHFYIELPMATDCSQDQQAAPLTVDQRGRG